MKKQAKPRGFVFYTQDYFGDIAVRLMPANLRLVWIEAFLLMDQSPRRGVLLKKSGDPYSMTELSTLMNVTREEVEAAFSLAVKQGIADVENIVKRRPHRTELDRTEAAFKTNPSLAVERSRR